MDSEKRKQKFWGYGFRFFSAECFLKFGEIRNSARRRGLGRNAGTFLTGFMSRKNNFKMLKWKNNKILCNFIYCGKLLG